VQGHRDLADPRGGLLRVADLGLAAQINGPVGRHAGPFAAEDPAAVGRLHGPQIHPLAALPGVGVAYKLVDGTTTGVYPLDAEAMAGATPVYESMPGWREEISSARRWEDLPANARAYCQRISDLLDVPIDFISVGAERNDLVALRWPI